MVLNESLTLTTLHNLSVKLQKIIALYKKAPEI